MKTWKDLSINQLIQLKAIAQTIAWTEENLSTCSDQFFVDEAKEHVVQDVKQFEAYCVEYGIDPGPTMIVFGTYPFKEIMSKIRELKGGGH